VSDDKLRLINSLEQQIMNKILNRKSNHSVELIWFEGFQVLSYPVLLKSGAKWFYENVVEPRRELPIYTECKQKKSFVIKFDQSDLKDQDHKVI
jgi:hypothetical protein